MPVGTSATTVSLSCDKTCQTMKQILLLLSIVWPIYMGIQSCDPNNKTLADGTEQPLAPPTDEGNNKENENNTENTDTTTMNRNMIISIGDTHYTATLEDSPTAKAFIALLPMSVTMTEMNGNEKYYNLSKKLPTETFRPDTIHSGDLLLWGTNTVVLFYKTFSSSYSYTRLGKIDDPERLATALGKGNVKVSFSIQQSQASTDI